ncbi:MAG: hypothetical protein J3K34DRAFT_408076 [Monoraphidium minutum]|nr:MAG: hypothetical protein J3K34DRAFT_408076 [Monoraphidium minutum]
MRAAAALWVSFSAELRAVSSTPQLPRATLVPPRRTSRHPPWRLPQRCRRARRAIRARRPLLRGAAEHGAGAAYFPLPSAACRLFFDIPDQPTPDTPSGRATGRAAWRLARPHDPRRPARQDPPRPTRAAAGGRKTIRDTGSPR